MTAIEKLNAYAASVNAARKLVEAEHRTMAQGVALMAKHGARTIADAMHCEACAIVSRASIA
jgi:hypothetical protein